MKRLALVVAASTTIFAAPAVAADLRAAPVRAPAPYVVAPFSWSGCYIGVQGGGAWGESRHINQVGGVNTNITNTYDVDGFLIGPTVGCNYQIGGFVLGIEGDWSWSSKEGEGRNIAPFSTLAIGQTRENWLATIRGRLGWAFDRWMIYATGGGAFAEVEARSVPDAITGVAPFGETRTRSGWTVGGGFEWAFAPNWSAKIEYLHVELENEGYFLTPPVGFANRAGGVPLHNDIVRAGINYRFSFGGWGGPVTASY
jgi:outer membrane immunogenic protein